MKKKYVISTKNDKVLIEAEDRDQMKNLEEFYREVIDKIFPSFSEEHRKHLNLMFREKTVEWLMQNRQERKEFCEKCETNTECNRRFCLKLDDQLKKDVFIDALVEDANAPPRKKNT